MKANVGTSHMNLTPVVWYGKFWAKREDKAHFTDHTAPSGSKVRQFLQMASEQPGVPMVVGCASYSAMQIYVASAAKDAGVEAHIFVPRRKERTEATQYAESMGAIIHEVFPGYANVYRKHARDFVESIGGAVRWDSKRAIRDTVLQCMNIPMECKRVVVPTGSGLTAAGVMTGLAILKRSDVEVVAVCVSDLADEDNIQHNCDYMLHAMTGHYIDPILTPRKPVLRMIRATGGYGVHRYETLPDGVPLDPYYAAKAVPYLEALDTLWVSGMRPLSACPDSYNELFIESCKESIERSSPFS